MPNLLNNKVGQKQGNTSMQNWPMAFSDGTEQLYIPHQLQF